MPFCCSNAIGDSGLGITHKACFDYTEDIEMVSNFETTDTFEREIQNETIRIMTERLQDQTDDQTDCNELEDGSGKQIHTLVVVFVIAFITMAIVVIFLRVRER